MNRYILYTIYWIEEIVFFLNTNRYILYNIYWMEEPWWKWCFTYFHLVFLFSRKLLVNAIKLTYKIFNSNSFPFIIETKAQVYTNMSAKRTSFFISVWMKLRVYIHSTCRSPHGIKVFYVAGIGVLHTKGTKFKWNITFCNGYVHVQ